MQKLAKLWNGNSKNGLLIFKLLFGNFGSKYFQVIHTNDSQQSESTGIGLLLMIFKT